MSFSRDILNESRCNGMNTQTEKCNIALCGVWSSWGDYLCNATCHKPSGVATRSRICELNGKVVSSCEGNSTEDKSCEADNCTVVGAWQSWGKCSESCGTGVMRRRRGCFIRDTNIQRPDCHVDTIEEKVCNTAPCEEKSVRWGPWSQWNSCSASCGEGVKVRIRTCIKNGRLSPNVLCQLLADEHGQATEKEMCRIAPCEEASTAATSCQSESCAQWSQWSVLRPCMRDNCQTGTQLKVRCKSINSMCIARSVQYSEASCRRSSVCV